MNWENLQHIADAPVGIVEEDLGIIVVWNGNRGFHVFNEELENWDYFEKHIGNMGRRPTEAEALKSVQDYIRKKQADRDASLDDFE